MKTFMTYLTISSLNMKTIHSWNSDGELVNPVGKEVKCSSTIGQ
jgi:hypothetical protein